MPVMRFALQGLRQPGDTLMAEETPKGNGGAIAGAAGAVVLILVGYFGWGVYQKSIAPEDATEITAEVEADVGTTTQVVEEEVVSETANTPEAVETVEESQEEAAVEAISETPTVETNSADTVVETETVTEEAPEDTPAEVVAETAPAAMSPVFDVVRIDPDGNALVAGKAEPGQLDVLLEGEVIAQTSVDNTGKFAALFSVTPSDLPRVMSLRATSGTDQVMLSEQSVIVEPFAAPVVVAEVTAEEPVAEPIVVQEVTSEEPAAETIVVAEAAPAEPIVAETTTTETTEVVTEEATPETPVEDNTDVAVAVEPTEAAAETVAEEQVSTTRMVVADGDGIRVVPSTPPSSVRIDTISYGDAGEVLLTGQGTEPGAMVRLYVNNTPLITAEIRTDYTWRTVLPDVDSGLYMLRADQISAQGQVTSRAQIPFQREAIEAVIALQGTDAQPVEAAQAPETIEEPTQDTPVVEDVQVVETRPDTDPAPVDDAVPAVSVESVETSEVPTEITPAAPTEQPVAVATSATEPTATVAVATQAVSEAPARPQVVTVQPGFTLWGIASENYGDGMLFVRLYEANKDQIQDPDLIYPGQIFALPE